jgi:hypothetical protein
MPELVTCPSCGFRLQLAEVHLGRRVRCAACAQHFTAAADAASPPRVETAGAAGYPLRAEEARPLPAPRIAPEAAGLPRHRLPLCPGCQRPVSWEAPACPHCGHLFDPLDAEHPEGWARRRDSLPHRGRLIDGLGTISVFGGVLSFCTGPVGVLMALGCAIPALIMAHADLARMREGAVDPEGRLLTEFGRTKALVGLALAVLGALFFFLAFFESGPLAFLMSL